MTTTTPNKTLQTAANLIAIQKIAASTTVVGSEVNVATTFGALVHIHFGRITTTAPAAGVNFRIESCPETTGIIGSNAASQWYPIGTYTTGIAAASTEVPSATSTNTLSVPGVTGLAAQDVNVVSSVTSGYSEANTEWFRTVSAASTTVTAEENFKNAYTTGGMWNHAEIAVVPIDVSAVARLRVVVDGSAHNQAFLTEVFMTTFDNVTTV
jgi:hypothetical protein